MEPKKKYESPAVKKVQLAINNAILATCHSSSNATAIDIGGCLATACNVP